MYISPSFGEIIKQSLMGLLFLLSDGFRLVGLVNE